jgi:hypothetical protein
MKEHDRLEKQYALAVGKFRVTETAENLFLENKK